VKKGVVVGSLNVAAPESTSPQLADDGGRVRKKILMGLLRY